jgi:hypothetical protein
MKILAISSPSFRVLKTFKYHFISEFLNFKIHFLMKFHQEKNQGFFETIIGYNLFYLGMWEVQ